MPGKPPQGTKGIGGPIVTDKPTTTDKDGWRAALHRIIWDEVKADVECEADAENPYQEGYAAGFNEARHRIEQALAAAPMCDTLRKDRRMPRRACKMMHPKRES
jgi:hypothetical protein